MYFQKWILVFIVLGFSCKLQAQIAYWHAYFGGSGYDVGKRLILRPDGSLVVAGEIYSTDGIGSENHSSYGDVLALKYSTQGVVFWKVTLGGSGMETLSDFIETSDGGYVLIGTTNSSDGDITQAYGQMDIWVVKLDDLGNVLWSRTYGGRGNDQGKAIIETQDGGYLIGGSSGSLDGSMESRHHGGLDSWVAKLSQQGELIWEKHFGGSSSETVKRIHEYKAGEYMVVHATNSTDGDVATSLGKNDVWITLIGEYGNIHWQNTYGGSANDDVHGSFMDANGDVVFAGTTFSANHHIDFNRGKGDFWLMKISAKGDLLWSQTYGGTKADGANDVFPTHDGGYVACGVVRSRDMDIQLNNGYYDAWVIKVDAIGNRIWSRTFGFEGKDIFNSIIELEKGGFLAMGFSEQIPEGTQLPGHKGSSDMWICNISDPKRAGVHPYITPPALMGRVVDKRSGKPLRAHITLTDNLSLDSLASTYSHPATGSFIMLLPTHGLSSINVLAKGYMFYGEDIRMDTVISKTSIEKEIQLEPIAIGSKLILRNIYFNSGEWELLYSSYAELERLLAFLKLNPRVAIEISGHTDDTGNRQQKEELSLLRANAVKEYLMSRGIAEYRLQVKGFGMHRPIASNATEAGRRKNRRVEFEIIRM
ncbi:MAG: OmpA family protein [Bacteroidetes bacterium]|nr:MAG: OmpA family protein [Bacteroidota bacterium]